MRKIEDVDSDLKVHIAKTDEFFRGTTEYRSKLCSRFDRMEDKLDSVAERLATMPCSVHIKIMEGMEKRINSHSSHIGKLYALAGIVAMALIYSYIGHAFGA